MRARSRIVAYDMCSLMGTEALWPAYLLLVLVPAGAQLMLRERAELDNLEALA